MKITGTLINYYFHCKRQCYMFANRLNMEDNSEDVRAARMKLIFYLRELSIKGIN